MKNSFIRSSLSASAALALLFALGGCSTPATKEAMTPSNVTIVNQHAKSVSVIAGGGAETDPAMKAQISDGELRGAVVAAIQQSKAFSSVVEGKNGDYILNVNIFNMDQPSMGFSFTVKMEMGWSLTQVSTGTVVWRESIKSEHTTGAGENFVGATRLRMATEGAAKNNVAAGIAKLSALKL